jgi:hypothetical protein
MDVESAKANLVKGRDVAYIARCIDILLQSDCADPAVCELCLPFLGQKLLDNGIIDFSVDPGVDITDRYFVLWEPFIRGKAALLIGTIAEKAESFPDLPQIVSALIAIFINENSEEIERTFVFFGLVKIGLKNPGLIVPRFPEIVTHSTALLSFAASRPNAFGLFHSIPFKTTVFESFLDLCQIKGIFENPDHVHRLAAAGLPQCLLQIGLSAKLFEEKHPELFWRAFSVFLRFLTEFPNGYQLVDVDKLPKEDSNDLYAFMRLAVLEHRKTGTMRSDVDGVKLADRNLERFKKLLTKWQDK